MSETYRVEMDHIAKSFGGVHALKDVTFKVKPGEIHALVGENGAGKSTLMKVLSGAHLADRGEVRIDGKTVNITNPHVSKQLGVGIIYQELALAPDLSVAENIYLGNLTSKRGVMQWADLFRQAGEVIKKLGFDIDPRARVGDLSVARQQVVEIAKALSKDVKILILDEPTTVLAPSETEQLFSLLDTLKKQGVSIIYISHRLEEIFKIADTITAIKDGSVTGTVKPEDVTTDQLISMMIGRTLSTLFPQRDFPIGDEKFRVEGLCQGNRVKDVSFSIRAGEVLGMAGLVGSGRTETVRAIFGADRKEAGTVVLDQQELRIKTPRDAVKLGIGLVPENRKEQGVILPLSLRVNMTMACLPKFTGKFNVIKTSDEKTNARELIEKLAIKTSGAEVPVSNLSGGNQQKVALAKWLSANCRMVILDEPTRGVDVGAKVEIYNLINELAEQGLAILVISSELLEVIGICDRILVMREGRVQGILEKEDFSEENIMKLAIGAA